VPLQHGDGIHSINPAVEYGKAIANIAGGFTAMQAYGGWIDGNDNLIQEPVTVFDIDIDTKPLGWSENRPTDKFRDLARQICQDLAQDCVYLRVDGKVELVKAKPVSHVARDGDTGVPSGMYDLGTGAHSRD